MTQDNIEVTNEDLARMIKNGFDHVDERFEQIDKSFETLPKKVADIGHKVNQIDKRLYSLEDIYVTKKKKQEKLKKRVSFVESKLGIQTS